MMIDQTLRELEEILFGKNYQVFLRLYQLPSNRDLCAEKLVLMAIPGSTIRDVKPIEPSEFLKTVDSCLRYEGDEGAGPDIANLRSARFEQLIGDLRDYLTKRFAKADNVWTFWFSDGHPAYPVFWDVSALIVGPVHSLLVVMSSSD